MNDFNPYLLIVPAAMAVLAIALLIAWKYERRQLSLCWMALAIFINGATLSLQSMLPPEQVTAYAIYTTGSYLLGAWLCSCSIAHKFRVSALPQVALPVALLTLAAVYYFSRVDEDIILRIYIMSIGLGVLHILPVFNVIRNKPVGNQLHTILYWTYLAFCISILCRPATLLISQQMTENELVKSIYWFITMLTTILFSMAFAFLLLASVIHSTLTSLRTERDLDPLTRLLNRRALLEMLHTRFSDDAPMTLVMADIDHFKQINDTLGHDFGDHILKAVAQQLLRQTRSTDLVARFGGEEFVLVLPHTDTGMACTIADRILTQLAEIPMPSKELPRLSMSFGISRMHHPSSFESDFQRADALLYQAKNSGRARICVDED